MAKFESQTLTDFTVAYLAGEQSDRDIQKQLIKALVPIGKAYKAGEAPDTEELTAICKWMATGKRKESHRTHAAVQYLKDIAKLRVVGFRDNDKPSDVKVSLKRKTEYGDEWLAGCKATPWFKVARDMQKAKAFNPETTLKQFMREMAAGYIMGDESRQDLIDATQSEAMADSIIKLALTDETLQEKTATRMEKLEAQAA